MTKRQLILNNIKDVLEGIPQVKTVLLNKLIVPDLGTYSTPICFIFSGEEQKQWNVINYESWTWPVYVEAYAIDTDMEELLGLIHNAMAQDDTRGGNALKCERVNCSAPMLVEPDNSLAAMLIQFGIEYRHVEGSM
jgi:hypothetical protein